MSMRGITLTGPAVADLLADLDGQLAAAPAHGHTIGFVYASDRLAADFAALVDGLKARTGIATWIGTVGIGVLSGLHEFFDEPAAVLLLTDLAADAVTLIPPGAAGALRPDPALVLLHADPRTPDGYDRLDALIAAGGGFGVGAILSARGPAAMVAGDVGTGGLTGAVFGRDVPLMTGLTQGCAPIGPARIVTAAKGDLLLALDGEAPLDCLLADLGIPDLAALASNQPPIHAALLVAGSDRADYTVRNILGLDPEQGVMLLAAEVPAGTRLQFVRRDRDAALVDLERLLDDCRRRGGAPRAALYINCIARGRHLFGDPETELAVLRAALGEIPLAGLYANGEIYHDRIYGYTGVLLLFL